MEKNREYLTADIEIVRFNSPDVITASGYGESKEDEDGWTSISEWA